MSTPSNLPSPATRLIVLVSPASVDEMPLARRIWTLALKAHTDVLYVALVRDADEESRARRSLALLTSLTRDDRLRVSSQAIFGSSWLKVLRPLVQPGDVIVCLADQMVTRLGRSGVPLSQHLSARLGEVVYVLDGCSAPPVRPRREIWPTIRATVPLAIIAGFLEFQMWITTQVVRGPASSSMLALSVVVEFSLIWLWVNQAQ